MLGEDNLNCGACGSACAAAEVCTAGACALSCPAGLTNCSGSCRDLQTDDASCGACGAACTVSSDGWLYFADGGNFARIALF